jgi:hypothetical protein
MPGRDHISSARDFWTEIAQPDYGDFLANPTDLRKAFHAAVSLYHISDWVWGDYKHQPQRIFGATSLKKLQKSITADECNDFGLIRDIADASRHFRLHETSPPARTVHSATDVTIRATGYGEGPFGEGPFGGAPRVIVDTGPGVRHLSAITKNVYEMWERLFEQMSW